HRAAVRLVDGMVNVLDQLGNDFVDAVVPGGRRFRGAGNDERSAGLVDQNGVSFVDNGELVAALDAMRNVVFHVVAKVVETVLVVGAISDVGTVGGASLVVVEVVDDHADGKSEAAIERAHPLGVAAGGEGGDGDGVE